MRPISMSDINKGVNQELAFESQKFSMMVDNTLKKYGYIIGVVAEMSKQKEKTRVPTLLCDMDTDHDRSSKIKSRIDKPSRKRKRKLHQEKPSM
jgi:hypothetical protein